MMACASEWSTRPFNAALMIALRAFSGVRGSARRCSVLTETNKPGNLPICLGKGMDIAVPLCAPIAPADTFEPPYIGAFLALITRFLQESALLNRAPDVVFLSAVSLRAIWASNCLLGLVTGYPHRDV